MKIVVNPDKTVVRKVKKEFKHNDNYCPYFLLEYGKQVHCFCEDIVNASAGTSCHENLYIKEED